MRSCNLQQQTNQHLRSGQVQEDTVATPYAIIRHRKLRAEKGGGAGPIWAVRGGWSGVFFGSIAAPSEDLG